jgi:hypothetical protein
MGIRTSGRGLRICGGDKEGMRDEIRRYTTFDGFNMVARKEGRILFWELALAREVTRL